MRRSGLLLRALSGLGVVLALATLGFIVPPRSYPSYAEPNCSVPTSWLPEGLPAPVQRYYSVLFGPTYQIRQVPVLEPAVVTGRGSVTLAGIRAPILLQAYYSDYERFWRVMDMTWLGIPVLPSVDAYLGGTGYRKTALGTANSPQIAQAENLTYWAEAVWMPSVYFDDPSIHWEAIDEETARLVVPLGSGYDSLQVRFDAQSGLVQSLTALRYRDAQAQAKSPWRVVYRNWQWFHEVHVPAQLVESWDDQAGPTQVLTVESIEYGAQRFLASHPAFVQTLHEIGPG